MKKIICFLLTLVFCLPIFGCDETPLSLVDGDGALVNRYTEKTESTATARWMDGGEFTPVLRFIAASDVHIYGEPSWSEGRFERLFRDAYAYAATQEYDRLDAIMLNGDLCELGLPTEYDRLMAIIDENLDKEQTQLVASFAGHETIYYQQQHPSGEDKMLESGDYITEYTGNDSATHLAINGYHFIIVSNFRDLSLPEGYNEQWVEDQFEIANAEDSNKPIFSFFHHPVQDTTMGSHLSYLGSYSTFDEAEPPYKDILSNYPQTIQFSSHTHSNITHHMAISQEEYTNINTGATNYMSSALMGYVHDEQVTELSLKLDEFDTLDEQKSYMIDSVINYDYTYSSVADRENYLFEQIDQRFYNATKTKNIYRELVKQISEAESKEQIVSIYKNFLYVLEDTLGGNTTHAVASSNMYIIEVDADNRIRIMPYDLINGKFFNYLSAGKETEQLVYFIEDVTDPDTYLYTDERFEVGSKPYFTEEAQESVELFYSKNAEDNYYTLDFNFPVAKDDDGVEIYWLSVTEKGKPAFEGMIHSPYSSLYYMSTPIEKRFVQALKVELEQGKTYQLIVRAKDFFGFMSDMEDSIVYEFTVE